MSFDPCPTPVPDRFGLSPTLRVCANECTCLVSQGCKCTCRCGCVDLGLDRDGRLLLDKQVDHHVLLRGVVRKAALPDDPRRFACEDRGGWWPESFGFPAIGSRIWTLDGERHSVDLENRAEEMIRESMADLVQSGIVGDVELDADFDRCSGTLRFCSVDVRRPTGQRTVETWDWMWETQRGA